MLSLRYRVSAKTALSRPITALSRSVYQFARSGHNPRTTILLTDLRDDVTLKTLTESVKDVKEVIGVELQPGCALHYSKQEDAEKTIDILSKLKYSVKLENVSLPALEVALVNSAVSDVLQSLKPVSQAIGKSGEELLVFRAPFRVNSSPEVNLSWIKDAELKKSVSVRSSAVEAKPAVIIRHVSHLSQTQVKDILRNFNPQYVSFHNASRDLSDMVENAIAVFPSEQAALNCLATIHNSTVNGVQLKANFTHWKEHIVQVHNLPQQVTEEEVLSSLGRLSVLESNFERSADYTSNFMTIVFAQEKDAELAELLLARAPFLKNSLTANSRGEIVRFEAGDIVVKFAVANPADFKKLQMEIVDVFGNKNENLMTLEKNEKSVAAFATLAEATVAKDVLLSKHAELGLSSAPMLTAHPAFAVELNLVNSTQPRKHLGADQSVAQLLKQTQVPAPLCTQRNALLKLAQHSDLVPVLKRLRPTASSTEGEAAEDTAASVVNAPLTQRLFGKAAAYRPLVRAGGTEYDNSPSLLRQQQVEDSLLLSRVARQEETHSVAVRYQLLRNEFERLCAAAVAANDASVLLLQSHGQNVKDLNKRRNVVSETNLQVAQELITQLIELKNANGKHQHHKNKHNNSQANSNKDAKSEALLDQLFHLFLRRSDKIALAEGVAEYILLDGVPISGEDAMTAEEDEEVEGDEVISDKLPLETSHAKDLKKQFSNETSSSSSSSSSPSDSGSESSDVDASTIDSSSIALTATSTDNEQHKVSLFSALQLRDEHGYVWHGTVLDTDMVQKTMPGKRIASHRALVVVGNMRGTAGFGSGKGKTPALAVEAAFRAALKKLSHIDLYENTGLAHDCFGQHNSCRAYVTATPPSRLAVASPFAEAVLNAFGIGSASVKLVGRRNPYSMVNAMFNALGKHENIDEYAKRRGKRYLTLKWLKEQKV